MYRRILFIISVLASAKTDTGSAEAEKELVYLWGPNPMKYCSKNQLAFLRVFPDNNVQDKHVEPLLETRQINKSRTIHGFVEVPRIKDYENVLLELKAAHPFDPVEMIFDSNIYYNTTQAVSPSYWRNNYTFVIRSGIDSTKVDICTGYSRITAEPSLINSTANISAYQRETEKVEDTNFCTLLIEVLKNMLTFKPLKLIVLGLSWVCAYYLLNDADEQEDELMLCPKRVRNGA